MIKDILRALAVSQTIDLQKGNDDIVVMKLEGRKGVNSMVSFLVWMTAEREPTFYLRTPRSVVNADRLAEEYQGLCQLRAQIGDESILNSIPEPVYFGQVNGYPVLLTSALSGMPMFIDFEDPISTSKQKIRAYIDVSMQWLISFQRATAKSIEIDSALFEQWFAQPVIEFSQTIGGELRSVGQSLIDELQRLVKGQIFLTAAHRDFSPYNIILLQRGGIGVVDWEHCALQGSFPLFDLFHFFVVSSLLLTRGEKPPVHGFTQHFLKKGWFVTVYKTWLDYCRKAWQLPSRLIELAFPAFLMTQALPDLQESGENPIEAAIWTEMVHQYFSAKERYP